MEDLNDPSSVELIGAISAQIDRDAPAAFPEPTAAGRSASHERREGRWWEVGGEGRGAKRVRARE